jgi:hypothetical protein
VTDLSVETDDLATYLGAPVDEDRASLLIELAMDLCAAIINPVPDTAKAIVLTAAGRAYSNPTGVTSEFVGPYQTTRPAGGVYLTKQERSALRLLTGSGGAFNVDILPANYPDSRFPDA